MQKFDPQFSVPTEVQEESFATIIQIKSMKNTSYYTAAQRDNAACPVHMATPLSSKPLPAWKKQPFSQRCYSDIQAGISQTSPVIFFVLLVSLWSKLICTSISPLITW